MGRLLSFFIIGFLISNTFFSCLKIDNDDQLEQLEEWKVFIRPSANEDCVRAFCRNDSYYAVIPSFWNIDSIVVFRNGTLCNEWKELGLTVEKSKLASVIISTESKSMADIDASVDKSFSESGLINISDEEGNLLYRGDLEKIHGRGNASWTTTKKPYNVKLRQNASLFDFRKSKSYCLLGADDPSMLRNKITYLYAEKIGMPYFIRSHHVSLWTNGEYRGVYLMTEKVSSNKSGANLMDDDSDDVGVIIEVPQNGDSPKMKFKSPSGYTIALKDPKKVSKRNFELIKQHYLEMETSIINASSSNYDDIIKYIDIESFVKYYLLQEVFYNYDAYIGSFYMYKDADCVDDKFYCAPLWDMDNCFNATMKEASSFYNRKHNRLISSLCSNSLFWENVQFEYNEKFSPLLHESFTSVLDSIYCEISHDIGLDSLLIRKSISPSEDVKKIKEFMDIRIDFLDNHIRNTTGKKYHSVVLKTTPPMVLFDTYYMITEYLVEDGDTFSLEGLKTKYDGYNYLGCFYENGRVYNPQEPIHSDINIYMKWEIADFCKRWKVRTDQWRVRFGAYRRALFNNGQI